MKGIRNVRKGIKIGRGRHPPGAGYGWYRLSRQETVAHLLTGAAASAVVAWLFYDSIAAWIALMPLVILSLKDKEKRLCLKKKRRVGLEFRELILSVSSSLQAGYSVENAFREAYGDIVLLFGRESVIARELCLMYRRLDNNEQLETVLMDLAVRTDVQDIRDFAEIFSIAKRGSSDMRQIIANTAEIIGDKQEVRREIETMVSEKKLEQQIMRCMPFFIIFYISVTTKGYFESLYHNLAGQSAMTAALIVYAAACRLADWILDIEV